MLCIYLYQCGLIDFIWFRHFNFSPLDVQIMHPDHMPRYNQIIHFQMAPVDLNLYLPGFIFSYKFFRNGFFPTSIYLVHME